MSGNIEHFALPLQSLKEAYAKAAKDTPYEEIFDISLMVDDKKQYVSVAELATRSNLLTTIDDRYVDPIAFSKQSSNAPTAKFQRTVNQLFTHYRQQLAAIPNWHDGPFLSAHIDYFRDKLRQGIPFRPLVMVPKGSFSEVAFYTDVLSRELADFNFHVAAVAGSQHIPRKKAQLVTDCFLDGTIDCLVTTSYLGQGHDLGPGNYLFCSSISPRATDTQQFEGRVGRTGVGFVVQFRLNLESQRIAYARNTAARKRSRRLINKNHRLS